MAFATQALRYGWVALASLGALTGVTIYIVDSQRHQVKPQDIIEIALGTYERCLATNPSVTPLVFVRAWTSNVYTTNGVTIYTNIVTNTIGWRLDRDMMVSLDAVIKTLVPYYVDTNTVYSGTTNIAMLTVTGLWALLGIGDRTNQFTRTPTLGTNAATYGDYPWQIYIEDLQERYKVLNALKVTAGSASIYDFSLNAKERDNIAPEAPNSNWAVAKDYVDSGWESNELSGAAGVNPLMESAGRRPSSNSYVAYALVNHRKADLAGFSNTNLEKIVYFYIRGIAPSHYSTPDVTNPVFNSFGYSVSTNWSVWIYSNMQYSGSGWTNILLGPEGYPQPGWCAEPTAITDDRSEIEGWEISDYKVIVDWQFNYCTNKFW